MTINNPVSGSFRDPCGFVFEKDGVIYRQVNYIYKQHYDLLMKSGLYKELVNEELMIPHTEVVLQSQNDNYIYKTLKPERIRFLSYPYEWCFSQLKDAGLITIDVLKRALKYGMILKDASAYNIQFDKGRGIFIDTLSFEKYEEGRPWSAYKQFCQHFLAPLSLMSLKDIRLGTLLKDFIDGIPLDLASCLLPTKSKFKISLLTHIHLHSKSQQHFNTKGIELNSKKVRKHSLLGLIENLELSIRRLNYNPSGTNWVDYYDDTNYSQLAFENKKSIVADMVDQIKPTIVLDIGANTGIFSRIVTEKGYYVISIDSDPAAVERNYEKCKMNREKYLLPLVLDLVNPSPSIGWNNCERFSWHDRYLPDTALVLALLHHLVISNNLSFSKLAEYFSGLFNYLIIEFVSKNDQQVQRLLESRIDEYEDYGQEIFEREFLKYFKIIQKSNVVDSKRYIYLLKKI